MGSKSEAWRSIAEKELRGRAPEDLTWDTLEGIAVQPLYTQEDIAGLDHLGTIPGDAPFTRGVKATMYAGRPWTIRQYAGFSTAEESNAFYRRNLAAGQDGVAPGADNVIKLPNLQGVSVMEITEPRTAGRSSRTARSTA